MSATKIAIVHYHLRPGGVTRVIEHTVAALANRGGFETAVLSGSHLAPRTIPTHRHVHGLDYGPGAIETSPQALADSLEEAAKDTLGEAPDLWHVHNHALGKKAALPDALASLQGRGATLLLQLHDFAEDGRPDVHAVARRAETRYPPAHYAIINQRDRRFLTASGFPESCVHYLPNPVAVASASPSPPARKGPPLLFYPARGIRRKNLGEMLLLGALLQDKARLAVALAPENPVWQAGHDAWAAEAARLGISLDFNVVDRLRPIGGADAKYATWQQAATAMVTTSVAEGFGLGFLEAAMLGKPLLGRDLPEITNDFRARGFDFHGLYKSLSVPLSWIGRDRLTRHLETSLSTYFQAYGRPLPRDAVARAFEVMTSNGQVDFGRLNEALQCRVLQRVCGSPGSREEVLIDEETPFVLWLDRLQKKEEWLGQAATQRVLIDESFSLTAYGERLEQLYQTVTTQVPTPPAPKATEHLLDYFLSPERFSLLRT